MKNNIKKIFSMMIVFLMAFALMMPAGASDKVDPKDNPTIDPSIKEGSISIAKKGSVFSVYKILDAEAKEGQNVFNFTPNEKFVDFFGKAAYGDLTINDIAKMPNELNIRDKNGNVTDPITEKTTILTNPLQRYINDNNITPVTTISCPNTGESATAENLGIGFYLIVETATHSDSASVASKAMLVPLPMVETANDGTNTWNYNLTITPKDEPVPLDKNIRKQNGEEFELVNTSTNNIGDVLDYQVDTAIPHYDANVLTHKDYPLNIKYWITDELSKGLTFYNLDIDNNPIVIIEVSNATDEKTLTKGTLVEKTITNNNGTEETVYAVENGDYAFLGDGLDGTMQIIFNYKNIEPYNDLTLTYQVIINENAVIGVIGNPNEVTLEYTNNPITGETNKPWDDTKTYTYGLKINKVDDNKENPKKLAGAEFQLLEDNNAIATYTFDENGKLILNTNEGKTAVTGAEFLDSENKDPNVNFGIAYLIGIKAGTYTLKETKAPDGYIIPNDGLELVITENTDSEGNRTVVYTLGGKKLSIENINDETVADGSYAVTTIENTEGFNLPMTGGAGTWMFTVGGILIMASMVAVFVKLRKKEN